MRSTRATAPIVYSAALLCCFLSGEITAQTGHQTTLTGTVHDANTARPLANANVFLDHTLRGTASSRDGRFTIAGVPAGDYQLVVSMMGYRTWRQKIAVRAGESIALQIRLQPRILQAPEVVITAPDEAAWRKQLARFKRLLLSTTANAAKCDILNPYNLEFSETPAGLFIATAQKPLLLENKALGYRLHFVLEEFSATGRNLWVAGYSWFEELPAQSKKQQKKWRKNRLRTYRGSLRHFFASLYRSAETGKPVPKEQGFEIFTFKNEVDRGKKLIRGVDFLARLLESTGRPGVRRLRFADYIGVLFRNEPEEYGFLDYHHLGRAPRQQESWIKLEGGSIFIQQDGHYASDKPVRKFGYWAWERLADRLPYEYTPPAEIWR